MTPHDEAQRFPAGEYVLQAKTCTGLAEWTKEVRGLGARCTSLRALRDCRQLRRGRGPLPG